MVRSRAAEPRHFCYRPRVPSARGEDGVPVRPAETHDALDALTARSAIWSLAVAGAAVALPAVVRPEAAASYLSQSAALLTAAALLAAVRPRVSPAVVARAAFAGGAAMVAVTAWVTGGVAALVYHAYSVALVGAAWLVFAPAAAALATLGIVGLGALMAYATAMGWPPAPWLPFTPFHAWLTTATACALMALVQWLEVHRLRASRRALADTLARTESALQRVAESERRYEEVVSLAPGVVYEFELRQDGSRAFTFLSEGARRLFEMAPEAVLADAAALFRLLDPPAQAQAFDAALARSAAALSPFDFKGSIRTPAGHVKWIRGHSLASRSDDGTVRWHGMMTDVTERTRTALALRDSQAALKHSLSMLQSAFESTADGLLIVDAKGRVEGYNQKFLALWRVPAVIASTRDDGQLLAHVLGQLEDPESFLARVRALYAQPDQASFDLLRFKDGRRFERYSQPRIVDGAVVGRVWSFRDVTARVEEERERQTLEHRLQQAQTLEALGTLGGGIAHEFNNLLTVILANAEEAADAADEAERRASLDAVTQAAHRASALVRELRDFSEPRPAPREVLPAAELVGTALDRLRTTLPPAVTVQHALDDDLTIYANPTQLQQVVTNLVARAAHAVGDGPARITVTLGAAPPLEVPASTPRPRAARYARLAVTDTGPGMPAGQVSRLFDALPAAGTAAGPELGLAVVHGLVRRNGGEILVESGPAAGTTFRVYFPATVPIVEAPAPATTSAAPTAQPAAARHILVVDDEADIVRVVSEGLRRLGYRVTSSMDPSEALAAFDADPASIDAVLTDLTMPRMSGVELARQLRSRRADLPVVLFTGHPAQLGPDEARAAGIRTVLSKPMTLSMLAEALYRALDPVPR